MIAQVATADAGSIYSANGSYLTSIDGNTFANTVFLSATNTGTSFAASCIHSAVIHDKTAAVCAFAAADTSSVITFGINCASMNDEVATGSLLCATNTCSIIVFCISGGKFATVFCLAIDGQGLFSFKFYTARHCDICTIAEDDTSVAKNVHGLISDVGFFHNIPSVTKPNPIAGVISRKKGVVGASLFNRHNLMILFIPRPLEVFDRLIISHHFAHGKKR